MARHGVFPGSFDPLTVAHVALARAARDACHLDVVELVISVRPLGKEDRDQTPVEERLGAIEAATRDLPWLRARATTARLLADIAEGAHAVVLGADKWHQLHDPAFYGSEEAMARALARLPTVAVAPRAGLALPHPGTVAHLDVVHLAVDPALHHVSSTGIRDHGRDDWRAG